MNLIKNFDGFDGPNQYAFLSNFYIGETIHVFGMAWVTGEHAFQGMKTEDMEERDHIRRAPSPGAAKARGRKCNLRDDWEAVKFDVMMAVLRRKFTLDRIEGKALVKTRSMLLVEGTAWNDRVWGVSHNGDLPKAKGRNWLGTLLMARRAELQAFEDGAPDYRTVRFNERFAE